MIFFTSSNEDYIIYMGTDKNENEHLIKYGWPEDWWFHVDKLSSAHVYVRCPRIMGFDQIPTEVVEEACQLVKHNSIKGTKLADTQVVYTPWDNLNKRGDMDIGTIGFHDEKRRHRVRVEKDKKLIKRLEGSRTEKEVDYQKSREKRNRKERRKLKKAKNEQYAQEKKAKKKAKKAKKQMHYEDGVFDGIIQTSNRDMKAMTVEDYEDNFM